MDKLAQGKTTQFVDSNTYDKIRSIAANSVTKMASTTNIAMKTPQKKQTHFESLCVDSSKSNKGPQGLKNERNRFAALAKLLQSKKGEAAQVAVVAYVYSLFDRIGSSDDVKNLPEMFIEVKDNLYQTKSDVVANENDLKDQETAINFLNQLFALN